MARGILFLMNKITEISYQKNDKSRCNVYINGEYSFAVSVELAIKRHLKKDLELSDSEFLEIKLEGGKEIALKKSINLLSKSLKTSRQIKEYLLNKGYSYNVIDYALEKLKEYNYLNDVEYAKRYIESTSYKQGIRLIEHKLYNKGISKSDFNLAIKDCVFDDKDSIKNLVEKRLKNKEINKETILKTYKYLISKGYSYDQAKSALREYGEDF